MKAVVKYAEGIGKVEFRDIPIPEPGYKEVRVRVVKAGICGSDMHVYREEMKSKPPVVMGHECIGYIDKLGDGITYYQEGQKVTAEIGHYVCGLCDMCRAGYHNMCIERKSMGYFFDGVFAEYVIIPERDLVLVPDEVSMKEGVLLEPLACICHATHDETPVKAGDVVLVIGPGPMGQMMSQVCKAFGATVVIVGLEKDAKRLQLAKKLGADYAVDCNNNDLNELLMGITRGYGADIVMECSGSENGINMGLDLCKKRGYMTQFAVGDPFINFNIGKITSKEIHYGAAMSSISRNYVQAINLLKSHQINIEPIASDEFPLEEWKAAFDLYDSKEAYKVIFNIGEE